MELSILGKDLLGEYEAKILYALNRTQNSMSGRQISRLIGAPNSTIQRILARFERIGLVQTDPHPGIVLYTLNKEHILYRAISVLFQIRKDFLDAVSEIFTPIVGENSSLVLYGSVARHESRLEDDVDLYLVHPDLDDDEAGEFSDKAFEAARLLERRLGNQVNIADIDETTFRNLVKIKDATLANILKEGREVIGKSIHEWASEFGWKPEAEKPVAPVLRRR